MSEAGLTKKMDRAEVEQAIQFLHETGAVLHFNDIQSNLSDLYFLDPQWLCSMMAKIITVPQMVIVKKGVCAHTCVRVCVSSIMMLNIRVGLRTLFQNNLEKIGTMRHLE